MKKLYGIGTGPGDEDLLTLKAVKAMKESQVIFAPNNRGRNIALDTAKNFIIDKEVVLIDLPMGQVTREDYEKAAKIIWQSIPENKTGAFLTIGDPMIYSTFIYIMEELEKEAIEIEIVNGIPSFLAAAGVMQLPLTLKGDNFLLCDNLDGDQLDQCDSLAILKTLRNKESILKQLEDKKFQYKYIKKISFEDQEVMEDKESILQDKNYMSLILARRVE